MADRTWTTLELLRTTTDFFAGKSLPAPRLAAERLLAHAWKCRRMDLYVRAQEPVEEPVLSAYRNVVRAYAGGSPLQYVMGETEFMGLDFTVNRHVLIPRPETELLVDAVERRLKATAGRGPAAVLELGVGSGAVSVSLAHRLPHIEIWATDCSAGAAAVAKANAERHGVGDRVHVLVMDRFEALAGELAGSVACVVSNPPYVTTAEMAGLPALVREYEPHTALHGGADGLDFHRYLCGRGAEFLLPGGVIAAEIGAGQGSAARTLWESAGLQDVSVIQDYAGLDRIVCGTR